MDPSKPLVLVVDDTEELREIFVEMLSRQGFPVASATDGADALRMLPIVRPAIVLLDMNMPEMDGLGFLSHLAGMDEPTRPVVIAMSADPSFGSLSKARGAFEFLEKPIDATVLATALVEASAGRPVRPELRAVNLEQIRERHAEYDERREDLLRRSRIGTPEFRQQLVSMLRWLSGYFDVPMALLNVLTGNRLELFENYGTPPSLAAGTTMASGDTYCANLIRNSESLVLHDALLHPLYSEHPVTALGIRFYVAVPIRTGAGLSVGTLCLESMGPVDSSTFRTEDLILLRHFADSIGERVAASVTDPQASSAVFPDPNLLDRAAFRAVLASRIAPTMPDAFPLDIVTLEGANADFVRDAGLAFGRLGSRRRLAIARHDTVQTVACLGSCEGLAALTSSLESEGLAFSTRRRTILPAVRDVGLTDMFGAL